ncbi:MAG: right-handed parallel beta-helix repeat-containing protein [Candidatus Falkowbacteria bacterium]
MSIKQNTSSLLICFFNAVTGGVLFFFLAIAPASASTVINGGYISTTTAWTLSDSPVIITGTVTVVADTVLAISSGAEVRFNPGANLMINGSLEVRGNATNPVIFTSNTNSTPGAWGHIYLQPLSNNNIIDHARVEYGQSLVVYSSNTHVTNSRFLANSFAALYISGGSPNITGNTFEDNTTAISINSGSPVITNNIINGGQTGISITGNQNPVIADNTLNTADWPIRIDPQSGRLDLNNNTITGPKRGIYVTSGYINADTEFSAVGYPYIISNIPPINTGPYARGIFIANGATLTIDPGVILKFEPGSSLTVGREYSGGVDDSPGTLVAAGTEQNKIIFTSIHDDLYGGDANGDGGATAPVVPGQTDNDHLYFSALSRDSILDHAVIRYRNRLYAFTDSLLVKNTLFENNSAGATVINSSPDMIGNIFKDNNYGLTVTQGNPAIFFNDFLDNAIRNIYIDPSAHPVLSSPDIYQYTYNDSTHRSKLGNHWDDYAGTDADNNGIGDTAYVIPNGADEFPLIGQIAGYTEISTSTRNPVIIVPGGMGSWNILGGWKLDPIFHTYDNLWEALKLAGYAENETLFDFPYQWRLSNNYTADLLKEKIQEVKNICQCDKVDIVAHSMGGLVARAYIEGNDYQNDIDKLVFLATPHQGASEAYLAWEGGEMGPEIWDKVIQRIFTLEAEGNGYGSAFQYIRGLPMQSAQELLPVYDYLRDKDTMELRPYPNNYPVNTFLELLNYPALLEKLNSVNFINVITNSGANSTINNFRVVEKESVWGEWEHGYPEHYNLPFTDHGIEYGPGDETVPEKSNKNFLGREDVIIENSKHLNIVTDAQKQVIKFLTGIIPDQEISITPEEERVLLIAIHSPADFVVISPSGKRLGKDFSNNTAVNEIDFAFYSGFDEPEFAVIINPEEGEYRVELEGIGDGEYKLDLSYIDEEKEIIKEFIGGITPEEEHGFDFSYSQEDENPISELEPDDNTPPVIIINSPTENEQYFHNEKLIVDYAITDDFSGVSTTIIKLDNETLSTTTIDLFYLNLATHTVEIIAQDKAGNTATKSVFFAITADIDSAIDDIEKCRDLGWITKDYVKIALVAEFKILKARLIIFDQQKEFIEKKKEDIINNPNLSDTAKQKLIVALDENLENLIIQRQKFIDNSLLIIAKTVDRFYGWKLINQAGYDMVKSDIEYLKINLH